MNIQISRTHLQKALNAVSRAVSTKPIMDVLKNVALEAKNNTLKLSATDLDLAIVTVVGAEVLEEGSTTVLARTFMEFISLLNDDNVVLHLKDNELHVKTDKVYSKFSTIPYKEFPEFSKFDEFTKLMFEIDKHQFSKCLDKVLFAIDKAGLTQPVFSGALFEREEDSINIVGTDRYRLSKYSIKANLTDFEKLSPIIPHYALDNISRLSLDTNEDVIQCYLSIKNNQVIFRNGKLEVISSIIGGTFPDYKAFLPEEKVMVCRVNTSEFINSVRLSSVFAKNDESSSILLKKVAGEKLLQLSAKGSEVGEYKTGIEIDVLEEYGDFSSYFSPRKILDVISRIDTEYVVLEIVKHPKNEHTMAVFKEDENDSFFHLLVSLIP